MSSPYNYIPHETGYSFTTDSGKQYIISFLTCSEYLFGTDVYGLVNLVDFSFFVQKNPNLGVSYAPRIAPTIAEIIGQLFNTNPEYAVIVTYCSMFTPYLSEVTIPIVTRFSLNSTSSYKF